MTSSHLPETTPSNDATLSPSASRTDNATNDNASPATLLTPEQAKSTYSSAWIRSIAFIALFAALFIGASFVKTGQGAAVPFSLQPFAVMLAGGLLGAAYGFTSIFLVVALTAVGLPLMNGPGGFAQIFGPTGGFIWMFPVSALLIGWTCDRLIADRSKLNKDRYWLLLLTMIVYGSLLLYVTGVPWLAHITKSSIPAAIRAGMLPYLPGDLIKAIVATFVIAAVRPLVPMIRPTPRKRRQ